METSSTWSSCALASRICVTNTVRIGLHQLHARAEYGHRRRTQTHHDHLRPRRRQHSSSFVESSSRETPPHATRSFVVKSRSKKATFTTARLWELSLLRLNQLGYFEPLKTAEQDGTTLKSKRITRSSTVDLTLKVKEKGKNSIGLNGGVSGLSGSFIGLTYRRTIFSALVKLLPSKPPFGNMQRNRFVRLYGAVLVRSSAPVRVHGLQSQVRLQLREAIPTADWSVGQL